MLIQFLSLFLAFALYTCSSLPNMELVSVVCRHAYARCAHDVSIFFTWQYAPEPRSLPGLFVSDFYLSKRSI